MAVPDLESAAEQILVNHGFGSVEGGRHVGHGTENRIVPLGPDYVELVAVVDQTEASMSPFGRWVARHSFPGATRALCLRSSRMDEISKHLGLAPVPMARTRPDGVELKWRLLGMDTALDLDLPFFIEWDVSPADHPGRTAAEHKTKPYGMSWVEFGGERKRIESWMLSNDLDMRIVDGPPGLLRVGIDARSGELIL